MSYKTSLSKKIRERATNAKKYQRVSEKNKRQVVEKTISCATSENMRFS